MVTVRVQRRGMRLAPTCHPPMPASSRSRMVVRHGCAPPPTMWCPCSRHSVALFVQDVLPFLKESQQLWPQLTQVSLPAGRPRTGTMRVPDGEHDVVWCWPWDCDSLVSCVAPVLCSLLRVLLVVALRVLAMRFLAWLAGRFTTAGVRLVSGVSAASTHLGSVYRPGHHARDDCHARAMPRCRLPRLAPSLVLQCACIRPR